jgi:hypothetical protein
LNEVDSERKRSASFCQNDSLKSKGLILKRGMLKKKGLFFYNNRILTLNARGILTYYDPKCQDIPKSEIDLKNGNVIVKLIGKIKDQLEIITKDQQYIFKVIN